MTTNPPATDRPAAADLDVYATPGAMTLTADVDPSLFAGLPDDAERLCGVSNGLLIHEFLLPAYGVPDDTDRTDEVERRTAAEIIDAITARDPRPLAAARPPEARAAGNCRQFSVLTCALLRRAGVPARVRAGFAGYFQPGEWADHWVVERWDATRNRWVLTDPQLDARQHELFGIDFDPLDVPADRFLTGGRAWQRYRRGEADPQRFGILNLRGPWFIACSVLRDLAALVGVEVHVWDAWGVMEDMVSADLTAEQHALVDRLAAATVTGVLADARRAYDADGIRVPGAVTSHRTGRTVPVAGAV